MTDNKPLFQGMDDFERTYAPESFPDANLPPNETDVDSVARDTSRALEPPAAAPVANVGPSSNAPSAPPNLGRDDGVGAPGDPDSVARYPIGDTEPDENR
jgi:hypothetical protein